MPAERISMRKIQDVLRLRWQAALPFRQIGLWVGIAPSTASDYVGRAEAAGLCWPLPEALSETQLECLLFPPEPVPGTIRPQPDWDYVHRELRRKGVTLQLLWQEYKADHPDGYQYSRFCDHYRVWQGKIDVVMRQEHRFGEKLFVDYAGQTVPVIDERTGEERQAQIFVAVLGASNYTYAEATWTQGLPDWIASHKRAFAFFGGTPEIVIPDNLKTGITKAHRYEPDINPTYHDLAVHYGVAIIPARVRTPRDKAKVEVGVQIVERWILAALRNHRFFSLHELNAAIAGLLDRLNSRPFKKLPGSRRSVFEAHERVLLRPLPQTPYTFAEWKKARVHIDYHVEVDGHYYSVPYQHARQQVNVRLTETTVEILQRGHRIASHARSWRRGCHTTVKAHMPPSHRHVADWTPERLTAWAAKVGPSTAALVERVIASRRHPEQGYRSCLGILRLGEAYGNDRLEAAAARALAIGAFSYRSLVSILKKGLDSRPLPQTEAHIVRHANIRGRAYYAESPRPDASDYAPTLFTHLTS